MIAELTGRRFGIRGILLVMRFYDFGAGRRRRVRWLVRCDCGTEKPMRADVLKKAESCGCLNVRRFRHGLTGTRTWESWRSARARCNNPNTWNYDRYGGRGIMFHPPWEDFDQFLADVGPATTEDHTIDRIDPDGNYEPGNVRWATWKEQAANRRYDRDADEWEAYERQQEGR